MISATSQKGEVLKRLRKVCCKRWVILRARVIKSSLELLVANAARLEMQTGDFEEIFDFVARLRPFFPDVDLSLYAGQLFKKSQISA